MRCEGCPKPKAVHPRVRGEHLDAACSGRCAGSSPRARGTRVADAGKGVCHRFIPACAGNTPSGRARQRSPAVHPRVRGEHRQSIRTTFAVGGSSPRARGTQRQPSRGSSHGRFIPACAGNTVTVGYRSIPMTVHPRVRGEHPHRAPSHTAGSVHPRVRGEHSANAFSIRLTRRFIPACAGNTMPPPLTRHAVTVHPRVRGEHRHVLLCLGPDPVHPRVRGEHMADDALAARRAAVHPRVRGEHSSRKSLSGRSYLRVNEPTGNSGRSAAAAAGGRRRHRAKLGGQRRLRPELH